MNLPNKLTMLRLIMIPFFLVSFYYEMEFDRMWISAIIFSIAAFTDFLDGYLARKYNLITNFGKFMDPMADKVLVASAFIMLVYKDIAEPWIVIIIIAREYAISILRAIAASSGKVIAASKGGKLKTASQLISIIGMLLYIPYSNYVFYFSAIVTLYSGFEYLYLNKDIIFSEK